MFISKLQSVFNDLIDVKEEIESTQQNTHLIASGAVSKEEEIVLCVSGIIVLLVLAYNVLRETAFSIVLGYLVLNILYTLKPKRIALMMFFVLLLVLYCVIAWS